ncbi:Heterokaryon incompatibility protein [Fusarium heterosporum]|uniref:Heterokaryon incompatibility protein n=1 Tax=Fusarium heterosporum TaxID=42747 RepID=A0A8H5WHJ2_FUSHE|nr:Heterokaryon incompatibility protein [Fusarium heterosporum]
MGVYTYKPVAKSEIRLVTVSSSGEDEKLEASLKNVELNHDDPVKYTALSYCWGSSTDQVQIPCDGQFLSVTTALHEALVEIIKFSPHEALWIDQICINQDDVIEKSEQVSKMNTIYDKAETVLAWLGPASDSTQIAIDFVRKVGDVALPTATDMFRWDSYDERHEETKLEITEELTLEKSHKLGLSFDDDTSWAAFSEFFDKPWFQRMWTVQEIIQARKAVVVCGSYSLDWEHVSAAAKWFCYKAKSIHDDYPRQVNGMCLVTQMVAIPWRSKLGSEYNAHLFDQKSRPTCKWSLRDLLEGLRPRLAMDPRDKVFGLLGISDVDRAYWGDRGMSVDYSMSITDVFAQATDEIIKSDTSDLNVIWSARQRNEEPEWPSWVPDWRLRTGTGCQWGIGEPLKQSGQSNGRHTYIPTDDLHSLAVRGKIVGRVIYKSEYRHFGEIFQHSHLHEVHDACMQRLSSYPTGEDVKTAFGLTLIGGLPLTRSLRKKETTVETYADMYMEFYNITQMPRDTPEQSALREEALNKCYAVGLDLTWLEEFMAAYCERRFVVTDSGYMGLAHHEVLEGDVVAAVVGLAWPCVLRPKSDKHEDDFEFIGDAYCHGIMNGEAVQGILNQQEEGQVFTLK